VRSSRSLGLTRGEIIVTIHPKRYLPNYEITVDQVYIRVEGRVKVPAKANTRRSQLAKALVKIVAKLLAPGIRTECRVHPFEEDDQGFYTTWQD
jgi:hypothetical protein